MTGNYHVALERDLQVASTTADRNVSPPDFRPIVQVIDNYDRNSKLGIIFETRVGPGKLLVCAMNLDTDADKRPAARQIRRSLLDYAVGDQFHPRHELSQELLERLLAPASR